MFRVILVWDPRFPPDILSETKKREDVENKPSPNTNQTVP